MRERLPQYLLLGLVLLAVGLYALARLRPRPAGPPPPTPVASPTAAAPVIPSRLVVHLFYYASEGEALARVEPALAACQREFGARIEFRRDDAEQPAGWRRLRELEQAAGLGSGYAAVEAFLEPVWPCGSPPAGSGWGGSGAPLALLGEEEVGSLDLAARRLLNPRRAPEPLAPADRLRRVREIFGPRVELVPAGVTDDPDGWCVVREPGGGRLGWARFVRALIDCPLCEDAQFLLALDAGGKIRAVLPLAPLGGHAREPAAAERFCRQFAGRDATDELRLGGTLDGITGATKSARLYVGEIRRALLELPKTE